jgi:hypothetical protein
MISAMCAERSLLVFAPAWWDRGEGGGDECHHLALPAM